MYLIKNVGAIRFIAHVLWTRLHERIHDGWEIQAVSGSRFVQWQQQIREETKTKPYLDTFMLISLHTLFYINTAKIHGGHIFPFYR